MPDRTEREREHEEQAHRDQQERPESAASWRLRQCERDIGSLQTASDSSRIRIAVLETKVAIWAALIGGAAGTIAALVMSYVRK